MIIEDVKSIDPSEARNQLASNASVEEIKSRIRAEDRGVSVRGNLRLDNEIFRLINIIVTPSSNKSVLDANISGPISGPRKKATNTVNEVAGH